MRLVTSYSSRKIALLQVSGGFEAGEPNSESISRSAIAELIVRSSFSARRSVWGARFDAVEKSNLFGFMFVITIESPEGWSSPKARRAVLSCDNR